MALTPGQSSSGAPIPPEPGHFRRLLPAWLGLSLLGDLLWWFVAGPHVPPGDLTTTASSQQTDFNVLMMAAVPVFIMVVLYLIYSIVVWRAPKDGPITDGPPIRTHLPIQFAWIGITTVVVLLAFVYGTVELIIPAGAGGGEGSNPIWTPASKNQLVVQVIGQQWKWTYRYPQYGGFETNQLVLPADRTIAFHVTSLDVVHDFWAYQIGVKADANPNYDNVAYTTTKGPGAFIVRCDELCGLWHGAMYNTGYIVSASAFNSWAQSTEAKLTAETKLLPPFAWTYTPDANGADGGYYNNSQDPYSNAELYTAPPAK